MFLPKRISDPVSVLVITTFLPTRVCLSSVIGKAWTLCTMDGYGYGYGYGRLVFHQRKKRNTLLNLVSMSGNIKINILTLKSNEKLSSKQASTTTLPTDSLVPRRFLVMKILSVNPVSYIQIRCRLSERAILQFTVTYTVQLKVQETGGAARNWTKK